MPGDGIATISGEQTRLLKYWASKCGDAGLPERKDISPRGVFFCLAHLSVVQQLDDGEFCFRLTGSMLRDVFGAEVRGLPVSHVMVECDAWTLALEQASRLRAPVCGLTPVSANSIHRWMRLPLRETATGTQYVMCYDRHESVPADAVTLPRHHVIGTERTDHTSSSRAPRALQFA